jgi:hypothetical protein
MASPGSLGLVGSIDLLLLRREYHVLQVLTNKKIRRRCARHEAASGGLGIDLMPSVWYKRQILV